MTLSNYKQIKQPKFIAVRNTDGTTNSLSFISTSFKDYINNLDKLNVIDKFPSKDCNVCYIRQALT